MSDSFVLTCSTLVLLPWPFDYQCISGNFRDKRMDQMEPKYHKMLYKNTFFVFRQNGTNASEKIFHWISRTSLDWHKSKCSKRTCRITFRSIAPPTVVGGKQQNIAKIREWLSESLPSVNSHSHFKCKIERNFLRQFRYYVEVQNWGST